jgi:hypothetical protein
MENTVHAGSHCHSLHVVYSIHCHYCLRDLQSRSFLIQDRQWRQHFPLKCWFWSTALFDVTCLRIVLIYITLRTWKIANNTFMAWCMGQGECFPCSEFILFENAENLLWCLIRSAKILCLVFGNSASFSVSSETVSYLPWVCTYNICICAKQNLLLLRK